MPCERRSYHPPSHHRFSHNSIAKEAVVTLQEYRFLEIGIRQCKSSGIDCKIHGIGLTARAKADEDDMAASFSFLALDEEDEAARQRRALRKKPSSAKPTPEGQVKVFVWGLNDKDQLGGLKGSKVRECWVGMLSRTLFFDYQTMEGSGAENDEFAQACKTVCYG